MEKEGVLPLRGQQESKTKKVYMKSSNPNLKTTTFVVGGDLHKYNINYKLVQHMNIKAQLYIVATDGGIINNFHKNRALRGLTHSPTISMEGIIKEINYDSDYAIIALREKGKSGNYYKYTFPLNIIIGIDDFEEDDIIFLTADLDKNGNAKKVYLKKVEDEFSKIKFFEEYVSRMY